MVRPARDRIPTERLQNSDGLSGLSSVRSARGFRDRRIRDEQQASVYDNQYSSWRFRCGDAVNRDAKRYFDMLNLNTQFVECAVCGIEESIGKVENKDDILSNTSLSGFFVDLASKRRNLASVSGCYGVAVEEAFDDNGLLRHSSSVCLKCKKRMQHKCFKTIKVTVANDSADDVHDDCDDNDDHDDHETRFDKSKSESKVFALMHGLFCGPIPMELDCLNYI